jgi:hypothetical protein
MEISAAGMRPSPDKLSAIRNFPVPKTKRNVKQFLGMLNYFRKFVRHFAQIAAPLNALLKKDADFVWTPECQAAFETLIHALVSSDLIQLPDFTKPFVVTTDASDEGIGGVLTQIHDGIEHVVEFFSRTLKPTEQLMSTFEKEALAAVSAVGRWHHYLEGRRFLLQTDNSALKWVLTNKTPSLRSRRWAMQLQQYDYEVRHKPGVTNVVADALSRNPVLMALAALAAVQPQSAFDKDEIRRLQQTDPFVQRVRRAQDTTKDMQRRAPTATMYLSDVEARQARQQKLPKRFIAYAQESFREKDGMM